MNVTIPKELATRIVWFCSRKNVLIGETIIDKNSTDRDIFIISRGQFRVHDNSAGEDFVLAMLKRGDIFGEMSFLDGSIRSASVTAASNGSLLVMGESEFSNMLAKEPEVAVLFLRFLAGVVSGRLRVANDALLQVAFGNGEIINQEFSHLKEAIAEMHAAVRMELDGA
ncbi:MAG: cyclic nucleotide-binding domain-containing protein [Candidatus Sabulitectum sp.]|nr:cyclic nucleotide-binding domain-containing protein [Candidatus Sabulitectum sp.]